MTISDKLTTINNALNAIKQAIISKGQTITGDITTYSNAINDIQTGGTITSLTVTPSTTQQTITAPSGTDGYNPITVNAVTSSIDPNIVAGNIKDGISILGVTGTYTGGGGSPSILPAELFIGDIQSDGTYESPPSSSVYNGNISFSGIKKITSANAMAYYLYATSSTSRCGARRISGTVSFPDLETVTGATAMQYMFGTQSNITAAYFPKLQSITGTNAFRNLFQNCTGLRDVYFNGLLGSTASASVQKMTNMLSGITGCTVHFPSNLQSIISSETIVTGGFGGINTVILYDLPVSSYDVTVNLLNNSQFTFQSITIGTDTYNYWSSFSNDTMTITLPVGQYGFTVDVSSGHTASPSSGTIDLTSGNATLNITMS